ARVAAQALSEDPQAVAAGRRLERLELEGPGPGDRKAHAIALAQRQAGQRGRDDPGALPLLRVLLAVTHAPGPIEDQGQVELVLALGLAHDQALGSRRRSPIEAPRIVAGGVGPVITKVPADART